MRSNLRSFDEIFRPGNVLLGINDAWATGLTVGLMLVAGVSKEYVIVSVPRAQFDPESFVMISYIDGCQGLQSISVSTASMLYREPEMFYEVICETD